MSGISEWIEALNRSFPDWHIHISDRLTDNEYDAGKVLEHIGSRPNVSFNSHLHLSVSMRSFRAEHVSLLVKQMLDLEVEAARRHLQINSNYPIVITRDLAKAKQWMKNQARGTERYGMVVSSQAERLKPHAIDVKSPMNPIIGFWLIKRMCGHHFILRMLPQNPYPGLELDWVCVTWDADFRYSDGGWVHRSFRGNKWQMHKAERQAYLKNAYRVLLTRARQGMVIVVPYGDSDDPTRDPSFYDSTYQYLKEIFQIL